MAISHSFIRKLVLIVGITSFLFSCSTNGSVEARDGITEKLTPPSGKELFLQHCEICHGEDGQLGASGAKNLTISKLDSNGFIQVIKKGKNGMPAMKELLGTEENISLVAGHVMKLRK
jgi:mono/diheme cytochrome c family protein